MERLALAQCIGQAECQNLSPEGVLQKISKYHKRLSDGFRLTKIEQTIFYKDDFSRLVCDLFRGTGDIPMNGSHTCRK